MDKFIAMGFIWLLVVLAAIVGYVKNIITLFGLQFADTSVGEVVVRVSGVFIPFIGAIAGYF